jgi:hypothetical protein
MKQHITTEQAKEIYDKMCAYLPSIGLSPKGYNNLAEWMTIGQMIELLSAEIDDYDLYILTNTAGSSIWKGIGKFDGYKAANDKRLAYECNLCDALWEAVKQILREDKTNEVYGNR